MKILIFTEGTILMHKNALGLSREIIVKQVKNKEESVKDYVSYVPIKNSVGKLTNWHNQGAIILYLTSRTKPDEIEAIRNVLMKYNFPEGDLNYRKEGETYADVAERIMPDVLIEDDCESIGGEKEMTITNVKPQIKAKIRSIRVKEFGGIDYLPDDLKSRTILIDANIVDIFNLHPRLKINAENQGLTFKTIDIPWIQIHNTPESKDPMGLRGSLVKVIQTVSTTVAVGIVPGFSKWPDSDPVSEVKVIDFIGIQQPTNKNFRDGIIGLTALYYGMDLMTNDDVLMRKVKNRGGISYTSKEFNLSLNNSGKDQKTQDS